MDAATQAVLTDDPDFLRDLVARVLQVLLHTKMTAHLGAAPYERMGDRTGQRNGYKPRQLQTRVGTLTLRVSQNRAGTFSTHLFARYQRTEKASVLLLIEMYLEGVSTRKVREITEALCGTTVSKSQVSRLASVLDTDLAAWRHRPLADHAYPYLTVDARYEYVRQGGQVISEGILIVRGYATTANGRSSQWMWRTRKVRRRTRRSSATLKACRLRSVRLVTSDDYAGLRAAIDQFFQGASWQCC